MRIKFDTHHLSMLEVTNVRAHKLVYVECEYRQLLFIQLLLLFYRIPAYKMNLPEYFIDIL